MRYSLIAHHGVDKPTRLLSKDIISLHRKNTARKTNFCSLVAKDNGNYKRNIEAAGICTRTHRHTHTHTHAAYLKSSQQNNIEVLPIFPTRPFLDAKLGNPRSTMTYVAAVANQSAGWPVVARSKQLLRVGEQIMAAHQW